MFEKLAGRTPGFMDAGKFRRYAVTLPFLPDTGELLFEVRAGTLRRQPGEICFPGGCVEAGETPAQTAVRETMEELLIPPEALTIIAPLDIYTASHHMAIYPFLASLHGYTGRFQPQEVQEVFTVPFAHFLEQEPEIYHNEVRIIPAADFPQERVQPNPYPWAKSSHPVYFYQYEDRVIWGMTARFIWNLVELVKAP